MNQPKLLPIDDKNYVLEEDFVYGWQKNGITQRIIVPRGFITDGASVPRLVWTISGIRPDGLHRAASVIHDYLYVHGGKLPKHHYQMWLNTWVSVTTPWKRKQADKLFCRVMKKAGVSLIKRRVMYRAVRLFGWKYWGS